MIKKLHKKLTKKKSQRIKTAVLVTGLLICCCIVMSLLFVINIFNNSIYSIDSRVQNIKNEKKADAKNLNYRTIAWLRVQGTNIDAPIISYNDSRVLEKIDKDNYLWNRVNKEKIYNQVTISGHNILNLSANPKIGRKYFSRFDDLMAFVYKDFVEENKYIQYTINGEDHIYKIFAVFFEEKHKLNLVHEGNFTKEEAKKNLELIKEKNIYDFDIEVNENDSLISLTTCTRMLGRFDDRQFVVVGRKLREKEKMTNYDVTPNQKYEEIEKLLGGDENNVEA